MAAGNGDMDDDSVHSATTQDQVSFWSLTGSFMLKLLAMAATIYLLPFNEWIVNEGSGGLTVIRGISGSDCLYLQGKAHNITCVRWSEPEAEVSRRFWANEGIALENVQPPSAIYHILFYVVLFQLGLYVLDLGATLVMCCRYKRQGSHEMTAERLLSLVLCSIIFFCYLFLISFVLLADEHFITSKTPVETHLGSAFKLLLVVLSIFLLGWALANLTRMLFGEAEDQRVASIQQRVVDRWQKIMNSGPRRGRGNRQERVQLQSR